jgi:hypothetical protein
LKVGLVKKLLRCGANSEKEDIVKNQLSITAEKMYNRKAVKSSLEPGANSRYKK